MYDELFAVYGCKRLNWQSHRSLAICEMASQVATETMRPGQTATAGEVEEQVRICSRLSWSCESPPHGKWAHFGHLLETGKERKALSPVCCMNQATSRSPSWRELRTQQGRPSVNAMMTWRRTRAVSRGPKHPPRLFWAGRDPASTYSVSCRPIPSARGSPGRPWATPHGKARQPPATGSRPGKREGRHVSHLPFIPTHTPHD